MLKTPRGLRTQIGIFGRRNVGKSTFMNALTRQNVSIVSDVPGTTTDPVQKAMELLPLGPVLLVDTAGLDDGGVLGTERTGRTKKFFDRADVAVVVSDSCNWDEFEEGLVRKFHGAGTPLLVVFNKADLFP
ncbi:MAG: 50S ribosome-binding GTPase, partial [Candidatus Sabulitectum sp.]|nr:50S ribosome-binding GTPase [Candidatus Sabulitectum sp.]